MTTITSSHILRHTTTFLDEALSQPDLRHRLLSSTRQRIPFSDQNTLSTVTLAAETLETAISTTSKSTRSSSLRLAEKMLLPSSQIPLSTLLLSLIYALCHRPTHAALRLLDLFLIDPSTARSEIAPSVFEDLFLIHLLPALQWFQDRRSRILASISPDRLLEGKDRSRIAGDMAFDQSACKGVLSRMSGEQAVELKDLERDYEEVLDENCRVFAAYFKEVLENVDGIATIASPSLVLRRNCEGGDGVQTMDRRENGDLKMEEKRIEESGLRNGRYNVMEIFFSFFFSFSIIFVAFLPFLY